MKIVYKAEDNSEFDSKEACLKYESNLIILTKVASTKSELKIKIRDCCEQEDYEGYTAKDVADFIYDYIEDINLIISGK